ncbi:Hypothetical predicted protein [Mytilus galloprovincialis]|uniref:Neurotransmitter-gated ion-channel ligand-binding domain-containing protein n=1 Tax=Mytilus galloprovincialis TaxID=29158 RepID=A0A8B6FY79_MYTGA|nr:Hypothetical predicted protein [Mytilus galloprovincialis]
MDHLKKLFHDIFETRVYDKRIRPVIDQSHPVYVDVSFFVIGLNSVDEENGIISTTFDTSLDWIDESATWKPELFGNITKLHVPQDHIWKPDFVVRNGMSISNDAQKKIGYTSIDYTGKTKWWPYQFHETSCEINISYFPFDKQICNVTFIIWSHSMNEIIIKGKYVGKHQFSKNALWSVDNLELFEDSEHLDGSDYSTITLTLYLSRKANFYMWNLIFPVVALSILQVVVFLVPAKSGEKLSFAFTLFLTYNMFLILMSSMFPEKFRKYIDTVYLYRYPTYFGNYYSRSCINPSSNLLPRSRHSIFSMSKNSDEIQRFKQAPAPHGTGFPKHDPSVKVTAVFGV